MALDLLDLKPGDWVETQDSYGTATLGIVIKPANPDGVFRWITYLPPPFGTGVVETTAHVADVHSYRFTPAIDEPWVYALEGAAYERGLWDDDPV